MLRGVLMWYGRPVEAEIAAFEQVFQNTVVVREDMELAPRTRLPLRHPRR